MWHSGSSRLVPVMFSLDISGPSAKWSSSHVSLWRADVGAQCKHTIIEFIYPGVGWIHSHSKTFYFTPEEKSQLDGGEASLGDISWIIWRQSFSFMWHPPTAWTWVREDFTPSRPAEVAPWSPNRDSRFYKFSWELLRKIKQREKTNNTSKITGNQNCRFSGLFWPPSLNYWSRQSLTPVVIF